MHKLRYGIDISKHLRVTFIGEPAIDDGGPMREYMRLLLGSIISNNSLFCGHVNSRSLRHNVIELNKKTYFYVGQILSITLVHGGPAPFFLLSQWPTTSSTGWRRLRFPLQMYKTGQSRGN
jgi:hypothetical protein